MFGKVVAGIVGGFVVAALFGNIVNLVSGSKGVNAIIALFAWVAAVVGAVKAPRAAKAWRWLLVVSAALSFTVPLGGLVWTTQQTTGAGVAGGLVGTGIVACVFFLLGLAFLIVGLLVGRDRKSEAVSGEKG